MITLQGPGQNAHKCRTRRVQEIRINRPIFTSNEIRIAVYLADGAEVFAIMPDAEARALAAALLEQAGPTPEVRP